MMIRIRIGRNLNTRRIRTGVKVHSLRWEVYMKYKEEFINREVLVEVMHTKGGVIVWTCVEDNIFGEKEECK